jgi:hypothetical protein
MKFVTGQTEREVSTQNTTVTKSAEDQKRNLLLVKMKEKKLLKIQP